MNSSRPGARSCGGPLIVVEHLEDHFSLWLRAEYRHAARLASPCFALTNARGFCGLAAAEGIEPCYEEPVTQMKGVLYENPERVIVLDPAAPKPLSPQEAAAAEAIIVGGILGDNPPRGRTRVLLTERAARLGMKPRSLGPHQLSIDGAVYVALQAIKGVPPSKVPLVHNPRITIDLEGVEVEVELPFSYPVVEGRPLLAPGIEELLRSGLGYEEYLEQRRARGRSL